MYYLTIEFLFPSDPSLVDRRAFTALAVILIGMSLGFILYEIWFHYKMRDTSDFFDYVELAFKIVLFLLTIVYVFGFFNECWCTPPWQWQIGALAVFMAYFNFLLLLKGLPWFGVYISMLLNIIKIFLKLAYLPILLILTFAFPFYMLFIRVGCAICVYVMLIYSYV